jgi:hypothetical protein
VGANAWQNVLRGGGRLGAVGVGVLASGEQFWAAQA